MIVVIDATVVPPVVTLEAADELGAFKAVVRTAEHVWVAPATLRALAGARADEPAWSDGLAGMVGYASRAGWTDERGRVRAHVELEAVTP